MRELTSLEKKEELKLAKRLKSKTHFNLKDILRLMAHHRSHCQNLDEMEKMEFINLINNNFKFDDKILLERIFQVFNVEKDGLISREEYVLGMSVFIFGKEKEQIKFCFSVYDLTGKGVIAKEEIATLLQKCLRLQGQEEEGEDGIKVDCRYWGFYVYIQCSNSRT